MSRQDTGTDDPRVRVRAGRGSRPRSKRRPDYSQAPVGRVVAIDRGRYAAALPNGTTVTCVKARELGRGAVVMGDFVSLTGDMSGNEGSLARIVEIQPRQHVLRRSLEEAADARGEKIIVANADQLVIVTAAADPQPRVGMVERCLVAAAEAQVRPLLCITKADLADPAPFISNFDQFNVDVIVTTAEHTKDPGLSQLRAQLTERFSVLVGHSGVGKSTLINALIPDAEREVGVVNVLTGKGRHTSTSSAALPLPEGGWVVDTPGVRSFGLSHASPEHVLQVFPAAAAVTELCLPNCSHLSSEPSCALDAWASETGPFAASPQPGPADDAVLSVPVARRAALTQRLRALLPGVGNPAG